MQTGFGVEGDRELYLALSVRQYLWGKFKKGLTEEVPLMERSHFSTPQTCPSFWFLQLPGQKLAVQSQGHHSSHVQTLLRGRSLGRTRKDAAGPTTPGHSRQQGSTQHTQKRNNGLAQNQHPAQWEPPLTQSHCISIDPLHTERQTWIKCEGTRRCEGTELQIPAELLELALSVIQKLLSITSNHIKKVCGCTSARPSSGFCLELIQKCFYTATDLIFDFFDLLDTSSSASKRDTSSMSSLLS